MEPYRLLFTDDGFVRLAAGGAVGETVNSFALTRAHTMSIPLIVPFEQLRFDPLVEFGQLIKNVRGAGEWM